MSLERETTASEPGSVGTTNDTEREISSEHESDSGAPEVAAAAERPPDTPQTAGLQQQQQQQQQQQRSNAQHITREDLAACFHMPSEQACRKLGVGLTVLKRQCRKYGIARWPFRKMKSLDRLITDVQEGAALGSQSRPVTMSVESLEEQKKQMAACAVLDLDEDTKRLQQAFSKAKHKARRANALRNGGGGGGTAERRKAPAGSPAAAAPPVTRPAPMKLVKPPATQSVVGGGCFPPFPPSPAGFVPFAPHALGTMPPVPAQLAAAAAGRVDPLASLMQAALVAQTVAAQAKAAAVSAVAALHAQAAAGAADPQAVTQQLFQLQQHMGQQDAAALRHALQSAVNAPR